jgi:hypothetical protein
MHLRPRHDAPRDEILGLKKTFVKVQDDTSALPLHWARNLLV